MTNVRSFGDKTHLSRWKFNDISLTNAVKTSPMHLMRKRHKVLGKSNMCIHMKTIELLSTFLLVKTLHLTGNKKDGPTAKTRLVE